MEKKVTEEQKKLAHALMEEFKKAESPIVALSTMAHAFCISPKYQEMGKAAAGLEKVIFEQFEDPATIGPALSHISRAILGIIYYETLKSVGMDKEGLDMFYDVLLNSGLKDCMSALDASNELFESAGIKSPLGDVFGEED